MKKNIYFLIMISLLLSQGAMAQWCSVTTAFPYSPLMPGITNFKLHTIDRTSGNVENATNSYVNTGLSVTLQKGSTYKLYITHTRDSVNFPTAPENLRVWLDYNADGQFDDPGETILSMDGRFYGTDTLSFSVPSTATVGTTRMRVTAKMGAGTGHIIPTPCDIPADPIGYHGEIEDYTVVIQGTNPGTGVNKNDFTSTDGLSLFPNPMTTQLSLSFMLHESGVTSIKVYDVFGNICFAQESYRPAGATQMVIEKDQFTNLAHGLYFVQVKSGSQQIVSRFVH